MSPFATQECFLYFQRIFFFARVFFSLVLLELHGYAEELLNLFFLASNSLSHVKGDEVKSLVLVVLMRVLRILRRLWLVP